MYEQEGMEWQEFYLGDFTEDDSPIADFQNSLPLTEANHMGQISVYEVSVTTDSETPFTIHFDLYDHVYANKGIRSQFAPFSHDAEGGRGGVVVTGVPEPASAALFGMGALSLIARRRRKLGAEQAA